jgi:PAS domain S-box-containing protein
MSERDEKGGEGKELRRKAEEKVGAGRVDPRELSPDDISRLLHELDVHQVELEMQNDELREAQRELERSRDRFAELYDYAPVGYVTLDPMGVVVEANHAAAWLLGTRRSELVGHMLGHYLTAADARKLQGHIEEVIGSDVSHETEVQTLGGATPSEGGRDPYSHSFPWAGPQSHERPEGRTLRAESIAAEHQTRKQCRSALIDVTEQRKAERELKRAHALLERRVAQRTADLRNAYASLEQEAQHRAEAVEQLEEAHRQKDTFLAMLAHELRNVLAPVRTSLELLEPAAPSGGAHQAAAARAMLSRQVEKLSRLVGDLLDVSRIARGKVALEKRLVDLTSIVRSAVETSGAVIAERDHTLEIETNHEPVTVFADPLRLAQVVTNLLDNAAKYTQKGGKIELFARREDDRAVVRVRDNGPGISKEIAPKLFDPFWQEGHHEDAKQGLGLGLALCKGLVEAHGGVIEVRSPVGERGTEFVIRLPSAASETEAADREPQGAEPEGADLTEGTAMAASSEGKDEPSSPRPEVRSADAGAEAKAGAETGAGAEAGAESGRAGGGAQPSDSERGRVLVVDDNADAADSLVMLLERFGKDVQVAYDGPSAIETARRWRPDLALIDIGMPQMDGYEVARRLRDLPETRDMALVALTGWGGEDLAVDALAAGFDRHLEKPAGSKKIKDLLDAYLPIEPDRQENSGETT